HRRSNRFLTATGAAALSIGMLGIVAGDLLELPVAFFAAAIVTGAGFGMAFMGGLRNLSGAIPPARRGEVMSSFYVIAYASLSLPAVAVGLALPHAGIHDTLLVFGLTIATLGAVLARGALRIGRETRVRPAPARAGAPVSSSG